MCLLFKTSVCQSVLLAVINPMGAELENLPEIVGLVLHLDLYVFSSVFMFSLIFSAEKDQVNDDGVKHTMFM